MLVLSGLRCSTTHIAAERSAGNALNSVFSASTPPADAPITIRQFAGEELWGVTSPVGGFSGRRPIRLIPIISRGSPYRFRLDGAHHPAGVYAFAEGTKAESDVSSSIG